MSSTKSGSGVSPVTEVKRKNSQLLADIKDKLVKLRLGTCGTKAELTSKLQLAESLEELAQTKPAGENWTVEEVAQLISFLPDDDPESWDPADVNFLYPILNAHSSITADTPAAVASKVNDIYAFYRRRLTSTGRAKTLIVSADQLVPMMTALMKKAPSKWGTKEVDLLLEHFANVTAIDAKISSAVAIEMYVKFCSELFTFYVRRPDIRVLIDPDVVIFDLSNNVDVQLYTDELDKYATIALSAQVGPFPAPWNPGPIATVFPMTTSAAAAHFVGFMRAAVPNLRTVVLPNYGGPCLLYLEGSRHGPEQNRVGS